MFGAEASGLEIMFSMFLYACELRKGKYSF